MVFCSTSALGSSRGTPACAPASTARASLGGSCSSGLPEPPWTALRKAWVAGSTPGLPILASAAEAVTKSAASAAVDWAGFIGVILDCYLNWWHRIDGGSPYKLYAIRFDKT